MSIPTAGLSIVSLLESEFRARRPTDEFDFKLSNAAELVESLEKTVTLYLYRVSTNPVLRHVEHSQTATDRADGTRRRSLSLELRYLLTVWSKSAETEQVVLSECMSILDQHSILAGDLVDSTYPMAPELALKVLPDSLSNEDLLRLWDGLTPQYRLSVPYVVRTIRLEGRAQPARPPVTEEIKRWTRRVP
ncbi:MAG: DUF4255 domain-containing protein [Myxococcales bacterium]|nr:DUF4255 domain-containing protein [Myxococcales bacterium]